MRSGNRIIGQYTTLPRGGSTNTGALNFAIAQGGSLLTHDSGEQVGSAAWIAKLPSQFQFVKGGEARWQSIASTDMDGAYQGSDGSRMWVRQTQGGQYFWYSERFAAGGDARPVQASVGIGIRGAQGELNGQFWDLPHQTGTLLHGGTVGARVSTSRDFPMSMVPQQAGASSRGATYKADYAVDLDRFEQEIQARLGPFAVGYSYAIAQDGQVVRKFAGGSRRVPTATNQLLFSHPFTTDTLNEMASTSKTVTAVAVLRALRLKGIPVDAPVAPHLPMTWSRGPGMDKVTFRQLLSHGLKPTPGQRLGRGAADCQSDFYGCLRDAVATGMVGEAGYDNIHYTLMRYLLPIVWDGLAAQLWIATQTDPLVVNEVLSNAFRSHVRTTLALAGVDADFQYVYGPGEIGTHRYIWGTPPTNELAPSTVTTAQHYLAAGSGGLKMKPSEFALFLSRLERGDILGKDDMVILRDVSYGETGPFPGPSGVGSLWAKAGGASGTASQLMVFPGTEVFYNQNSTEHPNQPGIARALRDAWTASLVTAP